MLRFKERRYEIWKLLEMKKFKCTRCPKGSKNDLRRHLHKIHHLNESEADNEVFANYPEPYFEVAKEAA